MVPRKPRDTGSDASTSDKITDREAGPAVAPDAPFSATTALSDEEVEALLAGEPQGALREYFGEAQYAELRNLAREAAKRGPAGDRVLILPGIMGSKLGRKRPIFDDVIWLAPLAIAAGRLSELRFRSVSSNIRALGVLLFAYLGLKLYLRAKGFNADFYPYDWRRSLDLLGKDLAADIDDEGRPLCIVAHSMGGLVARASLAHAPKNLRRIIQLGTPNLGSYAPVQAFRGASGTVDKVAKLDLQHSAAELAEIFASFPGLLQMIPEPAAGSPGLFDLAGWPSGGVRPAAEALALARAVQAGLPRKGDGVELILVAGVNQSTVVDARRDGAEFVYTYSPDGDGTVPLRCCVMPEVNSVYYVEAEHGSLPGVSQIQKALPSLLTTGKTEELPTERPPPSRIGRREVRESEFVATSRGGIALPGIEEQKRLAAEFVAPAPSPTEAGGPADATSPVSADEDLAEAVTIGRGRPRRLEITLARGSITEADAQCYVLGIFKSVQPVGPALALDAAMDRAITDMVQRRMFNGNVGDVSVLPSGRHPIRASNVAFVGLGSFDSFRSETLRQVGENLARTFVAARVDEFAMVPFGAGSGESPKVAIRWLLRGFVEGLKDADGRARFRSITICETDPRRFEVLRQVLYKLAGSPMFGDIEVNLAATALPEPARRAGDVCGEQRVYLVVREGPQRLDDAASQRPPLVSSVLTSGPQATIISGVQPAAGDDLDSYLGGLDGLRTPADVEEFGSGLAELVLPGNVRDALAAFDNQHLVVVHDAGASRIPWEALKLGDGFPALRRGLSHRYEASNMSVAKWLEARRMSERLKILVVANPTQDLSNAALEGDQIEQLVKGQPGLSCRILRGPQARKAELLSCISSGEFDVIHYAGHAFFDPIQRSRSGLVCADHEILSGDDLASASNLPSLMFFNACEAARIRTYDPAQTRSVKTERTPPREEIVRRGIGLAEALLRGGVANFVGTYWPVGDAAAGVCAKSFYPALLAGDTIENALRSARQAVFELPSADFADYVFYGDPAFQLKTAPPGGH